ncbi:MAG: hypothetical protein HY726_20655 [Candidatus Rokubacteria bacterium]|nr:hypothetical protein [Candidatus Rokubacteria bacterium]
MTLTLTPSLHQLLEDPRRAEALPPEEIPSALGDLERFKAELEHLRAILWSRMLELVAIPKDRGGTLASVPGTRPGIATPDRAGQRRVVQSPELEYLSIRELSSRMGYAEGTIRNLMSRGTFKLGEHYVKPRGRIMFKWPAVRAWLEQAAGQGLPHGIDPVRARAPVP